MERDEYYDDVRGLHIIRVRDGERSLQMSYTPFDFTFMTPIAKEQSYQLMEYKLKFVKLFYGE